MNDKSKPVTCSMKIDRDLYYKYKSVVVKNGGNVKENLISYMKEVIKYDNDNNK